ncbi:mechanosensitive ion channel domain-containing protein [Campylobacter ureolyticus]|uniref:Mechanosensitive ion channel n=1 Tax=Campylobacter ureolyticus TaxID=827 RepID=A0A9Q4KNP5_9BACT|nr:mechanosensitive ion channel domain-containing protein [Campylobacter ureolyticus]MCZ6159883.1 mechanosensitive ion channel [Campylobacter ureolyticus]MCZ6163214.1 mechanosensitive ion channel [Campylobacter ureolyticus]MCZ6165066.1 mechanosensitive ion channel [Campylobacter ureolyticus]
MRVLFFVLISFFTVFADENLTINKVDENLTNLELNETKEANITKNIIENLQKDVLTIDENIKNNIWFTQYQNYLSYQLLLKEKDELEKELKRTKNKERRDTLLDDIKIYNEQIALLSEFENMPFSKMLETKEIPEYKKISTPFSVLSGLSYIKQLNFDKEEYHSNLNLLISLVEQLKTKNDILNTINSYLQNDQNISKKIQDLNLTIAEFKSAKSLGKTTYDVYKKRIDDRINLVSADIKTQLKRAFNITGWVIFIFLLSLLFKFIVKKSVKDNERSYMANKFINFINFTLIIFILIFAYIDNVSYLVTVLGFASAGLAIAMKDMFMSMLGWGVIMIGGTFRVGDRIKARKANGEVYVGDIIDISLLRMTIYEDVTMTTRETRRAGRIIFVPNNYIFTELISNYTHSGMKTVWDGIDILLTFDSNYKKATYIVKNIARQYSKGYTDIAKKQMNKLRTQYSIKSPSVEPRIFHFFEPYGILISIWYMTDSYATLGLRSTISGEILEAFEKEDDIKIAYPTQTLLFRKEDLLESKKEMIKKALNEELKNKELNNKG